MKKTFLLAGLVFSLLVVQAQNTAPAEPVTSTLQDHFNRLKTNANNYKEHRREYKVVEVNQLNSFWNQVLNTVKNHENQLLKGGKNTREELLKAQTTIATQSQQIATLKADNAQKDKAVQRNAYEVDNIFVAGLGINKNFFMFFTFGLIVALVVVAGVILSLYKKSKKVTDEKVKAFQEIDHEFNEFKKAARERELKIKRELQTELNHKEEMRIQLASLQKQSHV